jgi:hypothetical protein
LHQRYDRLGSGWIPWEERDAKKALDLLWMMLNDGTIPKDFEIYLDAIQAGEPQEKIALEAGMTHDRFRAQLWTVRGEFLARCTAVGLGGLATLMVLSLVREHIEASSVAHHKPTPVHVDAGPTAPAPEVLVDTHKAELDALRTQAEAAVQTQKWTECHEIYGQTDVIERAVNDAGEPMGPTRHTCEEAYFRSLDSKGGRGGPKKK